MEYITKKDLIDCSTPDEFCFSLCCMECKTVWKSTSIRFSRAGKKPENENRKIIYGVGISKSCESGERDL